MSDNSVLFIRVADDTPAYQTLCPKYWGLLEIVKLSTYRVNLKFTDVNDLDINNVYQAIYHEDNGFSGWQRIILHSDLPNLIISKAQIIPENTVPANSFVDIMYTPTPVSGYTPFLYLPVAPGHTSVGIMAITSTLVRLRNYTDTNVKASTTIAVVYKRI